MRRILFTLSCTTLLLAGCGAFREAPSMPPQTIGTEDVDLGLPTTLPADFPLPASRDGDHTYTRTGKNNTFFSATDDVATLRAFFEPALQGAGYLVRSAKDDLDGGVTIHFERSGKLGYVHLLPSAPVRYDRRLALSGTFVDIVFEVTPPPAPVRTIGPTP